MHLIKQYMDHIIKQGSEEQMYELHNVILDSIRILKEYHHDKYEELKEKIYIIGYGEQLNQEMAKCWVESMKPDGEHWTMEQTTSVAKQYGVTFDKISEYTWYAIMNMAKNDFSNMLGNSVENYVKYCKAWLMDNDYPYPNKKAYKYYMMVKN